MAKYKAIAEETHNAGNYEQAKSFWKQAEERDRDNKAKVAVCRFQQDWEACCHALANGPTELIGSVLLNFLFVKYEALLKKTAKAKLWRCMREFQAPLQFLQACVWFGYYEHTILQRACVPLSKYLTTRRKGFGKPELEGWRQVLGALSLREEKKLMTACDMLEAVEHPTIVLQTDNVTRATALLLLARWNNERGQETKAVYIYSRIIILPSRGIQMIQAVAQRERHIMLFHS